MTRRGVLVLIPGGRVDPLPKIIDRFVGSLDVETETMRLVSVPRADAAPRGVRLDEVRKRDPHLDFRSSQTLERVAGPRQVVEMQFSKFGLVRCLSLERIQAILDYHRQRVIDAPEGAIEVRHTEPTPLDQPSVVTLRSLAGRGQRGMPHGLSPFRRMHYQGTDGLRPQTRIDDHDSSRQSRGQRHCRASRARSREDPVAGKVMGRQQA